MDKIENSSTDSCDVNITDLSPYNETVKSLSDDETIETLTNLDSIMTEDLITDLTSVEGSCRFYDDEDDSIFDKPKKKVKSFKERCDLDPDFKQRCKDRLNRKVICTTCDKELSRSSIHTHNRSAKHKELLRLKLDSEARAKVKYDIIKEIDYIRTKLMKPGF